MSETYHIFCGYEKPAVMSCTSDKLASWLQTATKDGRPVVGSISDWMDAPESVLVIRGTVVELELLDFLLKREA